MPAVVRFLLLACMAVVVGGCAVATRTGSDIGHILGGAAGAAIRR